MRSWRIRTISTLSKGSKGPGKAVSYVLKAMIAIGFGRVSISRVPRACNPRFAGQESRMPEKKLNRRQFAKSLTAASGALAGGSLVAAEAGKRGEVDAISAPTRLLLPSAGNVPDSHAKHVRTAGFVSDDGRVFQESARNIPIAESCDVVVCGGGPAGFAAALASARSGAKTRLLEVNGCVGGVWTAGALSLIIDSKGKPGIMAELRAKLERRQTGHWIGSSIVYDPESMKLMLEEMLLEAGVDLRYHTRVVGAAVDRDKRLTTVLTESKSGREAWIAKSYIDCTGDGDLAAQAGCEYDLGHPVTHALQPMSLMALFTGAETDDIARYTRGDAEPRKLGNPKNNFLAELHRVGVDPSYHGPTIFRIRHGLHALMANHQYAHQAIDADHVTRATLQARQEVHRLIDGLRSAGGIWQGVRVVATGEQIGTREGRRIRGLYHVDSEDLRKGSRFDDAICRVNFGIDVHATKRDSNKAIEAKPFRAKPYDIPMRALIARDVTGLMMAGRCISGDFFAHSSYRVTGDAVTMGEAAGVASAVAVQKKTPPHELPYSAVAGKLTKLRADAEKRAAG